MCCRSTLVLLFAINLPLSTYLLHSHTPIFTSTLKAKTSDYVLFKLDIDSKEVEAAIVDYLLSDTNDDLDYIDEFLWEHHVDNYLMSTSWLQTMDMSKSIADSYEYFLRLRQRGVRAYSWV